MESDHEPLPVGAWVRQDADKITSRRSENGAFLLTQQEENDAAPLKLFQFIPPNLHASIVGRTVNNTKAAAEAMSGYIQNAIDAAAASRRRLEVPAGLYNIAPVETFTGEGGPCERCFAIRSYMDIDAEPGASFRIVDEISTDAAPLWMCMFGTNEQLNNVNWRGLEMDMNGQNNPISPNRNTPALPNNGYSLLNQAQIFITGTIGGNASLINNAQVERCRFINTPGVSCLVMGQSNIIASGVGSGWKVLRSEFRNNGYDTVDHSSIYGWAEDIECSGNLFENDVQFGPTGGLVAYEVHGKNTSFTNNTVRRYYQGAWVDGNATNSTRNVQIVHNLFDQMGAYGVLFFGLREEEEAVTDTLIAYNDIVFDNNDLDVEDLKIGIGCTCPYSQVGAEIVGNRVRGPGTAGLVACAGVVIGAGSLAGQKHDRFTIEGNMFEFTSYGVYLATSGTVGLGAITIRNNISISLSVAGAGGVPQGVSYFGGGAQIDALTLESNQCNDDRAGPQCAFGIRLEGAVGRLIVSGNTARGMTGGDYAEVGFSVTTRVPTRFQGVEVTSVNIGGNQVVGPRGAAIADATDAASAITQLNALLAGARAHGLVAS